MPTIGDALCGLGCELGRFDISIKTLSPEDRVKIPYLPGKQRATHCMTIENPQSDESPWHLWVKLNKDNLKNGPATAAAVAFAELLEDFRAWHTNFFAPFFEKHKKEYGYDGTMIMNNWSRIRSGASDFVDPDAVVRDMEEYRDFGAWLAPAGCDLESLMEQVNKADLFLNEGLEAMTMRGADGLVFEGEIVSLPDLEAFGRYEGSEFAYLVYRCIERCDLDGKPVPIPKPGLLERLWLETPLDMSDEPEPERAAEPSL